MENKYPKPISHHLRFHSINYPVLRKNGDGLTSEEYWYSVGGFDGYVLHEMSAWARKVNSSPIQQKQKLGPGYGTILVGYETEIIQKNNFLVLYFREAKKVSCRVSQAPENLFEGSKKEAFTAVRSSH
jgi:hypothetical protein